jgi:hypothetical protein
LEADKVAEMARREAWFRKSSAGKRKAKGKAAGEGHGTEDERDSERIVGDIPLT